MTEVAESEEFPAISRLLARRRQSQTQNQNQNQIHGQALPLPPSHSDHEEEAMNSSVRATRPAQMQNERPPTAAEALSVSPADGAHAPASAHAAQRPLLLLSAEGENNAPPTTMLPAHPSFVPGMYAQVAQRVLLSHGAGLAPLAPAIRRHQPCQTGKDRGTTEPMEPSPTVENNGEAAERLREALRSVLRVQLVETQGAVVDDGVRKRVVETLVRHGREVVLDQVDGCCSTPQHALVQVRPVGRAEEEVTRLEALPPASTGQETASWRIAVQSSTLECANGVGQALCVLTGLEREEQLAAGEHGCRVFGAHCITDEDEVFWETERCCGLVNLKPCSPGHVLVTPKRPALRLQDLSREEHDELWQLARAVADMITKAEDDTGDDSGDAVGGNMFLVQDGPSAGQSVPHCHIHIIPRCRCEPLDLRDDRPARTRADMQTEARTLRTRLRESGLSLFANPVLWLANTGEGSET